MMTDNTQSALAKKIQQYNFAAYDMLLYLDTHPCDKKAFEIYKDLMNCYKKLLSDYENNYGPLTIEGITKSDTFDWLKSPWPWEACAVSNDENYCGNVRGEGK